MISSKRKKLKALVSKLIDDISPMTKGGPGSGNFGHGGRPGQVGGSSFGGGVSQFGRVKEVSQMMDTFKGSARIKNYETGKFESVSISYAAKRGVTSPLAGDKGYEFYQSLGHSREDIDYVFKLNKEHGIGGKIQEEADREFINLLSEDSSKGRLFRDVVTTETLLLKSYYEGHSHREELAKLEVLKEAETDEKLGLPKWSDDKLDQAINAVTGYPPPKLYRKGEVGKGRVESWTTNSSGAWMGGVGNIGHDHSADIGDLLKDGYVSLGGYGRMMGAPGESEITLYKVK